MYEPEKGKKDKLQPVDKIIIFFVDGANYSEYQALQQISKKSGKTIIYGSTDIINGFDFLQ